MVVFSDDPQHWNLPMTRWVTGTRPDQEGRFRVRNMPPGSYNIIAVDYIEAGSWGDPELLERLKTRAKRITLAEGGSEKLDLKLTDALLNRPCRTGREALLSTCSRRTAPSPRPSLVASSGTGPWRRA